MNIAYFDCFSGLSGDMVLGALLDIGVDFDALREELSKLPLTEYAMAAKPVMRGGIGATKVSVKAVQKGLVRTYNNIRQVMADSRLEPQVKERSLAIFQTLAQAQAKVNRKNVETVHFHEVGAVDSIVDIVGAAIGFSLLGVDRVFCSPLPMGLGMTRTDHGMMPIPSPVTLEILKGVPVYSTGIHAELVTPTGAAIARSYVEEFTNMPPMTVEKTGYGGGRADLEIPNALRLVTGALRQSAPTAKTTRISAVIDRLDDRGKKSLLEQFLNLGVVDVWLADITRPRARQAHEVNIIASLEKEEDIINAVFAGTSADEIQITRRPSRRRN